MATVTSRVRISALFLAWLQRDHVSCSPPENKTLTKHVAILATIVVTCDL